MVLHDEVRSDLIDDGLYIMPSLSSSVDPGMNLPVR